MNCPNCGKQMVGVEYNYMHPDRYDGISEWWCPDDHIRIGRWTGNALRPGEGEPPFGEARK